MAADSDKKRRTGSASSVKVRTYLARVLSEYALIMYIHKYCTSQNYPALGNRRRPTADSLSRRCAFVNHRIAVILYNLLPRLVVCILLYRIVLLSARRFVSVYDRIVF